MSASELVTVLAKFASSPNAAASSFNVSNVAGALSVIVEMMLVAVSYPLPDKYVATSLSVYAATASAGKSLPIINSVALRATPANTLGVSGVVFSVPSA